MTFASDADAPLRTARALAARQRALARIAPGLVHELRGPLNAVHLNVELLKTLAGAVEGETGDKLRRYVEVVEEELQRFRERFDRFVEQAFPAGREEAVEIDLRDTVRDVEDLVSVQARKERMRLDVEIPDEPVLVEGVAGTLRDALLQVTALGLGREDSGPGRRLRLELVEDSQEARITVRATGSEADLDDLLVDAARAAWEQQGGRVAARPVKGGGFETSMDFPLRESQARDE